MNYSKIFAIVFVLLLSKSSIYGCVCSKIPATEEYDYVALVEITGVLKSDLYDVGERDDPPKPIFHEVKIKTKEQFIGRNQEFLIVHGGNHKYNVGWTSCDMNMEIGEKWIIYGKKFKNRISTNYCSLSILHINTNNELDFKYNRSIKRLKNLKSSFTSKNVKNQIGKTQLYYPNGQLKLKEEYNINSELIGVRQAFYSNGQLMIDESYMNGLKNGNLTWYYRDGKTHRTSTFKNGKEICETYYFSRTGELRRINFYDDEGNYITAKKEAR